jgi:hypothetical protein
LLIGEADRSETGVEGGSPRESASLRQMDEKPTPYIPPVLPPLELEPALVLNTFGALIGAMPDHLKADIRLAYLHAHLVRVTDKAAREYNVARSLILAWGAPLPSDVEMIPWDETGAFLTKAHSLAVSTDHLESCIEATHRATNAVAMFRKKGIGTKTVVLDAGAVRRLKEIRDAMQHMIHRLFEIDLQKGRRAFGSQDPYGISPREYELTIGAEDPLTYVDLVSLIEGCYRSAEGIGGR